MRSKIGRLPPTLPSLADAPHSPTPIFRAPIPHLMQRSFSSKIPFRHLGDIIAPTEKVGRGAAASGIRETLFPRQRGGSLHFALRSRQRTRRPACCCGRSALRAAHVPRQFRPETFEPDSLIHWKRREI